MTSKRWAALAVALLLLVSIFGAGLTRAVHQGTVNCKVSNAAALRFNAALDQLIVSAANAQQISPAERDKRILKYASLHLVTVKCPSGWL
jgi:hypothetical protein